MNFVVVTPVRNEEHFIGSTIESVITQLLKPKEWIIINDNSSDRTGEIIDAYAKNNSWIRHIVLNDNFEHSSGSHIASVVNFGISGLSSEEYDFLVKLDADIQLPNNYFATIAEAFTNDSKLGVAGGVCVVEKNSSWVPELAFNSFHVRGALKSYRKECLTKMSGIKPVEGWDTLDEFLAMYYGYKVLVLPQLQVKHYKPTDIRTGKVKSFKKSGRGMYIIGFSLFFVLTYAIKLLMTLKLRNAFFVVLSFLIAFYSSDVSRAVTRDQKLFIRKLKFHQFFWLKVRRGKVDDAFYHRIWR